MPSPANTITDSNNTNNIPSYTYKFEQQQKVWPQSIKLHGHVISVQKSNI